MRDPARRNTAIAIEADCGYDTIARLRARLEAAGVIEPARLPYPTRNQGAYQRAYAEVRANPARSLRQIAEAASCAHPTVIRARRDLERAAAQRAQAAWQAFIKRSVTPPPHKRRTSRSLPPSPEVHRRAPASAAPRPRPRWYAPPDEIELPCCTAEWTAGGWRHERSCPLRPAR